jgi:cytochrome c oxidase cbb3-type subunit 3
MNETRNTESHDRLLDHEYDGIREYDNPMPRWWVWIFWATILYSILYALNVPGIGIGKGRIASYETEMADAEKRFARNGPALEISDDALRALAAIPTEVEEGRAQFLQTCSVCHRQDGGGMIGPNLTDAYWLHGGQPIDVYRTVHDGVPAKGMPAWSQVLKPDQMTSVVAFVLSLRGTSPKDGKGPEGIRADSAAGDARGAAARPAAAVGATITGAVRR